MKRLAIAALMILAVALPARAACSRLPTGLQLDIPNFGDPGQIWAPCLQRNLTILNSSAAATSSTNTFAAPQSFESIYVKYIGGRLGPIFGVHFSSDVFFSKSMTIEGASSLTVGGYIDTLTGYKAGGATGLSISCPSGQVLTGQVVSSGIVTGVGTCVIPGSGSGGGVNWRIDDFLASANGIQKTFLLSQPPTSSSGVFVVLDGLVQEDGLDYNFFAPTTILMTTAPASDSSSFYVQYTSGSSAAPNADAVLGATQTFSGANTFSNPGNTFTGVFQGTFTGNGQALNLNAGNLLNGTVPNTRLDSTSVTLQGNTFNIANRLVQLNGSGQIPSTLLANSPIDPVIYGTNVRQNAAIDTTDKAFFDNGGRFYYLGINEMTFYPGGTAQVTAVSEAGMQQTIMRTGTLRNISCVFESDVYHVSDQPRWTVRKNGVDTALVCAPTGSGTAGTFCADAVNTVSVVAGDRVSLKQTPTRVSAGGSENGACYFQLEF